MSKNIMVVEDDIDLNNFLTTLLERAKYTVVKAYSGATALEIVQTLSCDLILLDLMMPGINGNEFLQRTQDAKPEVPVIVVSASPGQIARPIPPQVKGFVSKPFQMKDLMQAVKSCLEPESAPVLTINFE